MSDAAELRIAGSEITWPGLANALLRVVALCWLVAGVVEWTRIVGVLPVVEGAWFWEAEPAVQVAAVCFAILYPLAGIGLWLLAPWGTVLWALAVLFQAVAHVLFAGGLGIDVRVVVLNLVSLAAYVVLYLVIARIRRAEAG